MDKSLAWDATAIAQTQFLAFGGGQETGFLNQDFGLDAKAVSETRFLGFLAFGGEKETGFLNQDFVPDARVISETRFLGFLGFLAFGGKKETRFLDSSSTPAQHPFFHRIDKRAPLRRSAGKFRLQLIIPASLHVGIVD